VIVDFSLGEKSDTFRAEVRAFLDRHLTAEVIERARSTGTMHDWEFHRALAAQGWLAAAWPREYGGQERDSFEMLALLDELKARRAPVDGMLLTMMVAQVVRHHGTAEQRRTIIPRAIAGEILICLGYTEPEAGSDVAAVRTSAVRDGTNWVINGQKMFTTMAHVSNYVFLLTRTNPDVEKHRGLTLFLVPLTTPGIEIAPIHTIGGVRTNVTYYTDVVVSDACRVGEVDGGWGVMATALAYERSGGAENVFALRRAVEAARRTPRRVGGTLIDDPMVRDRLVRIAIDCEVAKLLAYRSHWVESTGGRAVVEGSMHKLFSAEREVRAASDLLDVLGAAGVLEIDEVGAPAQGELTLEFRHSIVLPIYGGSSEVQRKIIAERHLGLPRSR
jgi:alkylation response protein AidB-like acyl-CoA dehydrogenase